MAQKIYKKSDRIKVKIGSDEDSITLIVSPLSQQEKIEIQSQMIKASKDGDPQAASDGVSLALKYAVKGIIGLEDADGNPYALTMNEDGLSDEAIDDILNMSFSGEISLVCIGLIRGVPSKFLGADSKPLPNVEMLGKDTEKK